MPCTVFRHTQALLASGWGDEESGAGVLNPNYDPALYQDYGAVRRLLQQPQPLLRTVQTATDEVR